VKTKDNSVMSKKKKAAFHKRIQTFVLMQIQLIPFIFIAANAHHTATLCDASFLAYFPFTGKK
jgi:hypothetical protein